MYIIKTCIAEQNIIMKKKYPFIEGRSDKNFKVVNLFTGSIFPIILFCTVMLFDSQAWSVIVVRPPWLRCEFLAELPLVLIL